MTITVLDGVVFPDSIIAADQPRGKSMRRNDRVQTDSGSVSVNIGWTQSLREYEFGIVPLLVSQWQEIEALFEITAGGAYGMLLLDPKDHAITTSAGRMSLVSGSTYQLQKRHQVASWSHDRKITRPIADSFAPYYDGAEIVSYTLDDETGQVTLDAPVADASLLSWEGDFYVPVHFINDYIEWEIVRGGPTDSMMARGPSAMLQEIRE